MQGVSFAAVTNTVLTANGVMHSSNHFNTRWISCAVLVVRTGRDTIGQIGLINGEMNPDPDRLIDNECLYFQCRLYQMDAEFFMESASMFGPDSL